MKRTPEKKKNKKRKRTIGLKLSEALDLLKSTKRGELADAIARDLVENIKNTRERVQSAREDIEHGARTKGKKDRFRL